MSSNPDQACDWDERETDPERVLEDLREGIQRAREQLRSFRDALTHDRHDQA